MAASMKLMFPALTGLHFDQDAVSKETTKNYQDSILQQKVLKKDQKCLLIGRHGSGKTALLFQCAVSLAHEGCHVTFITPTRFQSLPPAIEGATTPDPLLMKQIHIMYFQDRASLLSYLCGIHTKSPVPHAIIVDNLDFYASHPQTGDAASNTSLLCAYLVDAASFVSSKRCLADGSSMDASVLLVSITHSPQGDFPLAHIYRTYLTNELRIGDVNSQENIYQLTHQSNGTSSSDCIITYKLGQTIKVLDILMGDEASGFSQLACSTQGEACNG